MSTKPCLVCGEPSTQTRCDEHKLAQRRKPTRVRGYGTTWRKLSERARRLQPWCSDCGARADLQCDHSPEAWEAHDEGRTITLDLVDVVCGPCNRRRGAARGDGVVRPRSDSAGKAQRQLGMVLNSGGGAS